MTNIEFNHRLHVILLILLILFIVFTHLVYEYRVYTYSYYYITYLIHGIYSSGIWVQSLYLLVLLILFIVFTHLVYEYRAYTYSYSLSYSYYLLIWYMSTEFILTHSTYLIHRICSSGTWVQSLNLLILLILFIVFTHLVYTVTYSSI